MHPAMVGWLVLLLSWPHHLYPVGQASIAAPNAAAVIATAVGGVGLMLAGYVRWQIPAGLFLGVVIFGLLFQDRLGTGLAAQFLQGHVVLAGFFLATDSTCSPANRWPMSGLEPVCSPVQWLLRLLLKEKSLP